MVKSEYRSHSQSNMDRISRHNRFAKINPDNSVLVEVLLTAEQYELVQSGKYIVSLVDANDHMSTNSSLKLPNWRTNQKTNVSPSKPSLISSFFIRTMISKKAPICSKAQASSRKTALYQSNAALGYLSHHTLIFLKVLECVIPIHPKIHLQEVNTFRIDSPSKKLKLNSR